MSTRSRPKQLLSLGGDASLLARTLARVAPLASPERVLAVTSAFLRDLMAAELAGVPDARIIGEPVGKNTAPAIALAAHILVREDPDAVMIVLPADHIIGDDEAFRLALGRAVEAASVESALVTLGIVPTRPETEYGYIEAGNAAATEGALLVRRFTEKPDAETARRFLDKGGYYWNSGMFVWRAERFLEAVTSLLPDVAEALGVVTADPGDAAFEPQIEEYYDSVPAISVDYGILERSENVIVIPSDFGWDDVGAWSALGRVWEVGEDGSSVSGDAILVETADCIVHAEGGVVAAIGVSDLIVVHTPEATLVCPRDRARDVRRIVDELKRRGKW
jgi:mannose-1-phosphate guanylyltransferase